MSDEMAPEPVEGMDQPVESEVAPEEQPTGTSEESFLEEPLEDDDPLAPRYKDMQAAFTRKTQELAEQRKSFEEKAQMAEAFERLQTDPEFAAELLQELGYEFADEDMDVEEDDGLDYDDSEFEEVHDPRIDELYEAEMARREEAIEQQANLVAQEINSHIDELAKAADVELTDRERRSLFRDVVDEEPNRARTEELFKEFAEEQKARQDAWQKRWIESKSSSHVSKGGAQGSETFNIRDKDARIKRMKAIVEAQDAS